MSLPRKKIMCETQKPRMFRAQAHGKVNLHLGVGSKRSDGFHDLMTVFQALSLTDTVTLTEVLEENTTESTSDNGGHSVVSKLTVEGSVPGLRTIPTDESNLAWRAVVKVAEKVTDRRQTADCEQGDSVLGSGILPGRVAVHISKGIPIAGGMAGGSADAAAALVAANAWLGTVLSRAELHDIAAELGSDVPFCLVGGTALGTGRGEEMVPMLSRGTYWWVLAISGKGLSTPEVFTKFDDLTEQGKLGHPSFDTEDIAMALAGGNPLEVAAELVNDLQIPAVSLRPELRRILSAGQSCGALSGIVSGSGPTCAFLCRDEGHARQVAEELEDTRVALSTVVAHGPVGGAELMEPYQGMDNQ